MVSSSGGKDVLYIYIYAGVLSGMERERKSILFHWLKTIWVDIETFELKILGRNIGFRRI